MIWDYKWKYVAYIKHNLSMLNDKKVVILISYLVHIIRNMKQGSADRHITKFKSLKITVIVKSENSN